MTTQTAAGGWASERGPLHPAWRERPANRRSVPSAPRPGLCAPPTPQPASRDARCVNARLAPSSHGTRRSTCPRRRNGEPRRETTTTPPATCYPSPTMSTDHSNGLATGLRNGPLVPHKVNDPLRSTALAPLAPDGPTPPETSRTYSGVRSSHPAAHGGELDESRPVTAADGYHQIRGGYHLDPDREIPGRIVGLVG